MAAVQPKIRPLGCTERNWCRAVPGGTGITVVALLLSELVDIPLLQSALRKLQIDHPILNSKLIHRAGANSYSFLTPPAPATPHLEIEPFDQASTAEILRGLDSSSDSHFHLLLEHELNRNSWLNPKADADTFFASTYDLDDGRRVLALRFHTSACDRTAAAALLKELVPLLGGEEDGAKGELEGERGVGLGIEDCIPKGKAKKPLWARGLDMLGYSLNSFRMSNVAFQDTHSPRTSRVVRLKLGKEATGRILDGCKTRGIKLCGVLSAAGLIAARSSKGLSDSQSEKYAVVTIMDCRSMLDPALNEHHTGFYNSAILNTYNVKGKEDIWELSKQTYTSFLNAKNNDKHFTDLADMNFLMSKALDNPGLTPHSSMRTSFISVFDEPIFDQQPTNPLEDFIGCASIHGIGPSIAIFDTIKDGELDCACVYPSPLHSRQQMQGLVDEMKRILVER
ncbi:unnamed protein product [Cuscuta epithymum]|uniref:Phthiocerol/phthiodiolone dimycocerosyl transferase C-terminal domain-containing protein n=1 Tax=Cuscuta epithymum TaxID=186058 RepID=A0AAV0CBJ6_9ASTE|nr:unnamed protein product [Cuscuta epithymum]